MATTAPTSPAKKQSARPAKPGTRSSQAKRTGGFDPDSVTPSKAKPGEKPSDFAGLWLRTRPND